MAQDRHNQQPDRRANRTILGRTLFLMVIFGVVAFIPLFATLYDLQITRHDELEAKDSDTEDFTVTCSSYDDDSRSRLFTSNNHCGRGWRW